MKCPDCGHDNIAGSDECSDCHASLVNIAKAPKRGMERKILEGALSALSPKRALEVRPTDSLNKAVDMMRGGKVGSVLVTEKNECVGILSERELIRRVPESADLEKIQVKDVMWPNPTCLDEDDQVAIGFHRMAMSGHLHVPIRLKDGSLGVFSARDLLRYLCK